MNGRLFVDYDASFGGNIALNSDAAQIKLGEGNDAIIKHDSSTGLDIDSAGALSLNSSAGLINIGNDAVAQNMNIGTGAAERTITIGNATGATLLDLDAEQEELILTNGEVNIASSKDGASALVLTASAGGVDITATGAAAGEDINVTATGSSINITSRSRPPLLN